MWTNNGCFNIFLICSVKCCYTHTVSLTVKIACFCYQTWLSLQSLTSLWAWIINEKNPLLVFTDKVAILSLKSLKNILWVLLPPPKKQRRILTLLTTNLTSKGGGAFEVKCCMVFTPILKKIQAFQLKCISLFKGWMHIFLLQLSCTFFNPQHLIRSSRLISFSKCKRDFYCTTQIRL